MIKSFCDRETAELWKTGKSRLFNNIAKTALRKLDQLDASVAIDDMKAPPGNRLERLKNDRDGQWSVRINDQWRLCFEWKEGEAWDVEIVDYH